MESRACGHFLGFTMKDLQMWNLVESTLGMSSVPGWEVFQEQDLLLLKSPARRPLLNLAWGPVTARSLEVCEAFFAGRPWSWMLKEGQEPARLLEAGFHATEPSREMVLDLAGAGFDAPDPSIRVQPVASVRAMRAWTEILGEAFDMPPADMEEFFGPLVKTPGHVPFLATWRGLPAATASVFLGATGAGIYAVATRAPFRRKGLGRALVQACLREARRAELRKAVLYSSVMGQGLYEKAGFRTEQAFSEYCTPGYPH